MGVMNRRKPAYLIRFFPLRRNFFLVIGLIGVSWYWYQHFSDLPGEGARAQIILSLITMLIAGLVLLFSLLSGILPYISLWLRKRLLETDPQERRDVVKLSFAEPVKTHGRASLRPGWVTVQAKIAGIRRPLLGMSRVRIIFDDGTTSEEIPLDAVWREGGRRRGIRGQSTIWLPHIRDYRVRFTVFTVEDFFHLFAFSYREAEGIGVFIEPPQENREDLGIVTQNTEEPVLKVLQHKFAKGELLDYKKYAPGDDIRRIIWKNYARTGELTVRQPEINLPYVSHINLLVSFYDGSPHSGNPPRQGGRDPLLKRLLLDVYKEKLRQVVDSITNQGFTIRFLVDQEIGEHYVLADEYHRILYSISACDWQRHTSPESLLQRNAQKLRSGSNVLVFSSLCPAAAVFSRSNGSLQSLNLCFYNVAETFARERRPALLRRLFYLNTLDPLPAARSKLSARKTVKFVTHNSRAISQMLKQAHREVIPI